MKDQNCMYCVPNQTLEDLMLPICDLGAYKLYLFKNQCYKGRVILACKDHVRCVDELAEEDAKEYFGLVHKAAKAVKKIFSPKQINIGTFGDTAGHVHCHIVPKYEGELDFGAMFQMNPEPGVYLSDSEYQEMIDKIKQELM